MRQENSFAALKIKGLSSLLFATAALEVNGLVFFCYWYAHANHAVWYFFLNVVYVQKYPSKEI